MDEKNSKMVERASTTNALPVAPSMAPLLESAQIPARASLVDRRVIFISLLSILIAFFAGIAAEGLMRLIGFVTNLSFYGRFSFEFTSPTQNHLGAWVIVIPVIGGLIVGLMARFGSSAIRGHGIPEAMEQVLTNQSRVAPRITFLKPLSAALAIGTGGPFGAEGPIIATGGAAGSLVGQIVSVTATERKTLLAAGAAAGMSATFGCPVAAMLLAIELLLFEFRPRSFIPVALASVTAAGIRFAFGLPYPIFTLPLISRPGFVAMMFYLVVGVVVGFVSIGVTRSVYFVEDCFARLPLHWMWWPALGAIPVGLIGWKCPQTLGVGYENISDILCNRWVMSFVLAVGLLKFLSWSISLGSGTSGGTLAPLFTVGSALGALMGAGGSEIFRHSGIDVRTAALVGMAAMFAGASRALLASIIFAFETTLQPMGLLPLMGGCTVAYFVSCLYMPNTIMTEKMARRGVRVPMEYAADFFAHMIVENAATKNPFMLKASQTVGEIRRWMSSATPNSQFEGYPILDESGHLVGIVTRRDLLNTPIPDTTTLGGAISRPPTYAFANSTLREAADLMVTADVGRLPVVRHDDPTHVIAILTRSDLLEAHRHRLDDFLSRPTTHLHWPFRKKTRA